MPPSSPIDVLLVYPSDGMRLFQSMVPLGMLSIGTLLEDAGYKVWMVDFNHYRDNFKKDLLRWNPRLVGIGGTTPSRMKSSRLAQQIRTVLPDATIVYGGVNATFTAEAVLRQVSAIDFVITGEGEFSFMALCDKIMKGLGGDFRDIAGLAYRAQGQIVVNKAARIDDLAKLPFPRRDLVQGDYRLNLDFTGEKAEPIVTSRGCPAACNFCSASRMFPGGVRFRPMDQVRDEIEYLLSRSDFQGLKVFDSTFTAHRDHVMAFCEMVKPFGLKWECEIRADTVDPELLKVMKEAGCYYVNMGLESSDPVRLKKIAKGIQVEQGLQVLDWCREAGIYTKVFFTFGHPGQTWAECKRDIQFIRRHRRKIDFFAVTSGLRVYPGTRLEKEARTAGLIAPEFNWTTRARTWKNYLLFEPTDTLILFQPQLGAFRLMRVILKLFFSGLYSSPGFMWMMVKENVSALFRIV